jgi:hypothetical protein
VNYFPQKGFLITLPVGQTYSYRKRSSAKRKGKLSGTEPVSTEIQIPKAWPLPETDVIRHMMINLTVNR